MNTPADVESPRALITDETNLGSDAGEGDGTGTGKGGTAVIVVELVVGARLEVTGCEDFAVVEVGVRAMVALAVEVDDSALEVVCLHCGAGHDPLWLIVAHHAP